MLTVGPLSPGAGSPSGVEVGAVERAVAGFGLAARGWNVVGAASVGVAVVRADRATGQEQGSGPGC